MAESTVPTTFDRPGLRRRAVPLLLIILLHLGLVALLRNGLLQRILSDAPPDIVTVMLFPAAPATPTPAPTPAVPAVPKSVSRPAVRPRIAIVEPAIAAREVSPSAPSTVPAPAASAAEAAGPTPAAPLPTAAPATAGPKTVSSGVAYLQAPRPDYPAQSKRLGEDGRVVLRVLVNQQGAAEHIDVQKSSGFIRLDDAAREAAQQARFKPHLEDGRPVAVFAIVPITFRLDQ